jgi:hypothetical protein
MSNDLDIPVHNSVYVADGSVTSKYSPAAYLKDLWDNAKSLHLTGDDASILHRRSDLTNLTLNQDTMDTAVSTLSLSNALLADMCKKSQSFRTDNSLMADVANNTYANNYHQPLETLRELIAGLGDDPFLMLDPSVASHLYAGIAPQLKYNTEVDIAQIAQVWALTELHGVVKEEAQVMCGLDICTTPRKDDASGTEIPSQINRLFNVSDNNLPNFTDNADVEKKLMQAFGINNTELNLLASLTSTLLTPNITLSQVSTLYGWVLMSRSLGCTVAELVILYHQLPTVKPAMWMLYTAFKTILDWLDERKITVSGLLLLINEYPYDTTPAMDTLKQELMREQATPTKMTKTALAGAISTAFNLSSISMVEASLQWLDADSKHAGWTLGNSDEILNPIQYPDVRYVLLVVETNSYFSLSEVQVLANGENVALNKTVKLNPLAPSEHEGDDIKNIVDGDDQTVYNFSSIPSSQSWVQIDLQDKYDVDAINILPLPEGLFNATSGIHIYVSANDMSKEAATLSLGNSTTNSLHVGFTGAGIGSNGFSIPSQKGFINNVLQRTLIASSLGLNVDTLAMLSSASNDPVVCNGTNFFTLERLQELSQLKALVDRCGSNAPALLAQLSKNSLNVSLLAQYLNVDAKVLTPQKASTVLNFSDASNMLNAYLFAQRSGMSLSNLDDLRGLKLNDTFDTWAELAHSLMSELPPQRFNELQQKCEEGLSKALSLYYCSISPTLGYETVEELSSYLLTDLQTSAQSKTSQIAWAIASVQLYIERCLTGEEPRVDESVKSQQFFEDWGRYNSRYSEWAALAELKYEPENYVDPSLRLKATESFKNLQQQLVNGPLNEDVADDAFYSYLTDFEEMADIATVNAYHDVLDNDVGTTWFIGQTMGNPTKWYWRSVDHSKLSAGAGAVQAWSGWDKIDIPISPISNNSSPLIRPVFFNNRLYVAWVEARDKKASGTNGTPSSQPNTTKECIFKIAHQHFNGSWSMPAEKTVVLKNADLANFESGNYTQQTMYITVDTLANQMRICIGESEWFINDNAMFMPINVFAFYENLYNTSTNIINGNSATEIVAAYPYTSSSSPIDSVTGLKLTVNNIKLNAPIYNQLGPFTGTVTFSDMTTGLLTFSVNSDWHLDSVPCYIDQDGKLSASINLPIFTAPGNVSGEIANPDIILPIIKLTDCITIQKDSSSPDSWTLNWSSVHQYAMSSNFPAQLLNLTAQGIAAVFELEELREQPERLRKLLDFEGALGCYYWELFFHAPLLISLQLQQAQDYVGAAKWLGYIFDPNANLNWKPLPLLDDTTWNPLNIQTTDPDMIAESDPMHYKLATFMRLLDLLIARGDSAYRLLERDTLVEAQMWYLRALNLLGDQPDLSASPPNVLPVLDKVVDTDFQPQENKKLNGYWLQLGQRLYNLRHNLTLDGQPLNLPLFGNSTNSGDLLSAELNTGNDSAVLTTSSLGLLRFKPALERARGLAGQLVQFGNTLQGIAERQDGEAMSQLLQTQAIQLVNITCDIQDQTLAAVDGDLAALQAQYDGVVLRKAYYSDLYDENISANEQSALSLNETAAALLITSGASSIVGGALDTAAPNIFGLADGGNRWGAIANGISAQLANTAFSLSTTAGVLAETESYRRRRDEWKQQMDSADCELKQLDNQKAAMQARQQAASMQKNYLLTQRRQTGQQLQFLKSKFTNQQLYSWMRCRLSTIFSQFYDITVAASLRVEQALQFEMGNSVKSFVRPGAWQNSAAGLLCGESLLIDLAQMEAAWIDWDKRALEVTRTVSLASVLKAAQAGDTAIPGFPEGMMHLLDSTAPSTCSWTLKDGNNKTLTHVLKTDMNGILTCEINLAALNIPADYPASQGAVRRIKNISVSLPAMVGPYQDIQAVLSYSETGFILPAGCAAIAVSHGVNDSGQFQLDFNDPRYLPFEGVTLLQPDQDNAGTLSLQFPNASGKQKSMLASLNDIILHIRYTIRN